MSVTGPSANRAAEEVPGRFRFIDIGVNLTDPVFRGMYRGKRKHDDDLYAVLERSRAAGVKSMIITGGSLHESREALELAKQLGLYATVGCHPTRSKEFDTFKGGPDAYLNALDKLIEDNLKGKGRVVAVGECGLDYDRTHFAPEEVQKKYFRVQLSLAKKHHLPLFLHSRAAHPDFVQILREEGFGDDGGRPVGARGGVVHSFTGSVAEAEEYMSMGFHISVNGCSLKTEDNLIACKAIRPDKIMVETDAPWCSMTSTHASKKHLDALPTELRGLYFSSAVQPEKFVQGKSVKGRNEPAAIGGVAW
ncbi:Mg-dependent DNase, partial [Gloeophyllum trabeum ATCC 11539]